MFNKITTDKLLHLLVCLIIALVAWLFSGLLIPKWSPVFIIILRSAISFLVAALFSLSKEAYDSHQEGNHFCRNDLMWDMVGAIIGCIIGIAHFFIS